MESSNSNSSGGIGLLGLLQVALIVLKLCDVIKGSWLLVFIPTWIGIGLTFIYIAIYVILDLLERKDK